MVMRSLDVKYREKFVYEHTSTLVMTDALEGNIDCSLYDPYRREDRFGLIGTKPMGLEDRLLFLFFSAFVLPLRCLIGMVWLFGCYLSCTIVQLCPSDWQPVIIAPLGRMFCQLTLMTFGILTETVNLGNEAEEAFPCGIVSNHVSWLDILVHMAHDFPSFVAATKVKKLPFVGRISEMMGCIYVEREKKDEGYQGVSGKVRQRMEQTAETQSPHHRILLFPEGTTTNGKFLLKFKKGAFLAGLPVQPVVLLYSSHWLHPSWETVRGARHVRMMLTFPYARVRHIKLPVYSPSVEERTDPERFAQNVRNYMITASRHPFLKSDATIVHKRQYQALLRSLLIDNTNKKD